VTFATNRSATAGPLAISSCRRPGYLHSALGTRPVRRDRPSRAQLSARFGDADGDDVPPAVIQGLLTTRSRRVGGHMHAPPPIAQEREKKILERRAERLRRTDTRARARAFRSTVTGRHSRHAARELQPCESRETRFRTHPRSVRFRPGGKEERDGKEVRSFLRARADSRDWRETPPVAIFR